MSNAAQAQLDYANSFFDEGAEDDLYIWHNVTFPCGGSVTWTISTNPPGEWSEQWANVEYDIDEIRSAHPLFARHVDAGETYAHEHTWDVIAASIAEYDDALRERVHRSVAPCSNAEYLAKFCGLAPGFLPRAYYYTAVEAADSGDIGRWLGDDELLLNADEIAAVADFCWRNGLAPCATVVTAIVGDHWDRR